jgi:predicted TIM-barrel fold metal-dependent hydrolase
MAEVEKYGYVVPMSDEIIRRYEDTLKLITHRQNATPEELAELKRQYAERERVAAEDRRRLREQTPEPVDPIVGIAENLGLPIAFVRHLAQPYCDCDVDQDGAWNRCEHARDLGLDPYGA